MEIVSSTPSKKCIFRNYFDWRETFPELSILLENFDDIAAECKEVQGWTPWPERNHYGVGKEWDVFPFVHTFPAWDESNTMWIEPTCKSCPKTKAILSRIPKLRTALFSRLGPGTTLAHHTGWADLANHVLRCHLPLSVPVDQRDESLCGLTVCKEVRLHKKGELVVFDDSRMHSAYNSSADFDRTVLILDLERPADVQPGSASGKHTPELDSFINLFK